MTIHHRIARQIVLQRLARLQSGSLAIHERERVEVLGRPGGSPVHVHVNDPRFYGAMLWGGHIGAAEAYAAGWWGTPDLTALVRLFLQNREALDGLEGDAARLVQPFRHLAHLAHANTRRGSQRNIAAHYDLGNDLFALFLDETMTYSSGYFEDDDTSLADASRAKYERICRKLQLEPHHHVVEIGSGWGGFAMYAAERYGCRVTAVTISPAQHRFACQRISEASLADRVTVLLSDYRDVRGQFDRLVSIEMIEAVGSRYFDTYFRQCARLLTPDGLAAIQAITIQPRYYERARREVDFIKKHIFPGSCIPSIPALAQSWAHTDLRLVHCEDFGSHYARTLHEWACRFDANGAMLDRLGYDEWFQRMWRFYFAYCEAGFAENVLSVSQLVLAKPAATLETRVPQRHEAYAL